jgi:outer membrane protein assembly factor BamB
MLRNLHIDTSKRNKNKSNWGAAIGFTMFIFSITFILNSTTSLNAAQGKRLWSYKSLTSNFDASAGIGDVDRDGFLDVVVVSLRGDVIALDGYGREIWKTVLDEKITNAPTVLDVTKDAGLEVLVITQLGKLYCLDGLTGKQVWRNSTLKSVKWASMNIVATDINLDGNIEIITADLNGTLLCIDGNGKEIWRYNESEGIGSAPAVGDIDGDGEAEIIIASEDTPLICLNNEGKLKWRYKPQGDVLESGRKREVTAPVIQDINGDGIAEIVTGNGFELTAINNKGELIWSYPIKNRIDSGISIADVDGDGNVEIFESDLSGNLTCVSSDGKFKWTASLGGRARRAPAIADVDGDGAVEILATSYGGKMKIFDTSGKLKEEFAVKGGTNAAPVIADLFNDGGLCAIVPEISGNLVVYQWDSVIEKPEILWPEYRGWASRTAGEYIKIKRNGSTDIIGVDPNEMIDAEIQKFSDNFSELKKTLTELIKIIPQMPNSKGFLERVHFLSAAINKSTNQVENVDDLTPIKRRKLRDNLTNWNNELSRWFAVAKEAVEQNKIITAYAANPWAPFGGMDEVIEGRTPEAKISVEAFQGEYESTAANLFNFSGSSRTLRVMVDKFTGPEGAVSISADDVITLREVIDVPTQDSDLSSDALPELNTGNLLVVPAWNGRQLWFTINTAKLTSGTWKAKVHLKSLDVQFIEEVVEISIKIWDTRLPVEQPLNLCNWSGTKTPKGTFEDQIAHGVNVFTRSIPPKATFNESGNITKIDYTKHDAYMANHVPHGTVLFHSLVKLDGPAEAYSDIWLKAYSSFIPQWIKHLKEQGYDYDNFAFYPQDEPGLEHGKNVARLLKLAIPIRKIDPQIRIYANPVSHITIEQLEEIEPFIDIWTPLNTMIFPEEKLEFIHATRKQFWNYACSDNAKNLTPLEYSRFQAWMSWHYGHTGIGFYTYYQGSNYWFQPESGFEYGMIYEGKGVVTSKRWEAVRDGVEDYTLLHTLKKAVETASESAISKELVKKAKKVYNEKAAVVSDFTLETKHNANYVENEDIKNDLRKVDERFEMIINIRREIAELLVQLQIK